MLISGKTTRNDDAALKAHSAREARVAGSASQRGSLTIDGLKFKRFVQAGYLWLRQQEPIINSYNVYPVPDGDTGTNMMHTMRSAWEACANASDTGIGSI